MRICFQAKGKLRITVGLIVLSLIAWVIVFHQLRINSMSSTDDQMAPGISPLQLVLFLGFWLVMMSAMMLPSAAPMITTYAMLSKQRYVHNQFFPPTLIFLSGYLIVWTSFGVLGYLVNPLLSILPTILPTMQNAVLLVPVVLVLAGIYQLTPLKYACLSHCRTPLGFILHHWREGKAGALRMGIDHGLYCVGCCWALMAILVIVGAMNLVWMALLTLAIFIEKVDRRGLIFAKIAGIAFVTTGLTIAFQSIV